MFNIGGSELLVILFVALIFLGPERLPTAARQLGKTITQLRQMAAGFQREFEDAVSLGEEQARANGAALVAAETDAADGDTDADIGAAANAGDPSPAQGDGSETASDAESASAGFDTGAEPDRTEKPISNDGPMFHSAAPDAGPRRTTPVEAPVSTALNGDSSIASNTEPPAASGSDESTVEPPATAPALDRVDEV